LLTLPITLWDAILGKFLAAWFFTGLALLGTFPLWLSVNYLGEPDNGAIAASYVGSWFMAGAFLAVGCCLSALTKSQIIAFILTGTVCLLLVLAGFPLVLNFFQAISKGVLALVDVVYFVAMMALWLYLTRLVLQAKSAD
jgi:ABC-2 type transport system permease protein